MVRISLGLFESIAADDVPAIVADVAPHCFSHDWPLSIHQVLADRKPSAARARPMAGCMTIVHIANSKPTPHPWRSEPFAKQPISTIEDAILPSAKARSTNSHGGPR